MKIIMQILNYLLPLVRGQTAAPLQMDTSKGNTHEGLKIFPWVHIAISNVKKENTGAASWNKRYIHAKLSQ